MIEQNISTVNVSRYRYTDIVTFAIDSNGKCYAIKVCPTPFDANASTFDEYLTKSMEIAEQRIDHIFKGILNVKRFPDISECDENCPKIAASLEFGKWNQSQFISKCFHCFSFCLRDLERSIKHFNEFETTLRNLNAKIVQTHNNEWQLYECAAALDKLYGK